MSQKPSKSIKGNEKTVAEQTLSSSDPLVVKSSKGKSVIVTKIETPVEQEKKKAEEITLQEFRKHPIEYLKEASLREYEIEGDEDEIDLEYDQMTDSDIEKEIEKMKPEQKAHFKEVKDLLTIQARLKGKILTLSHLIQTYISRRYPGIPLDIVKQHAEIEEPEKQDLHKMRKETAETLITEHDRCIP